MSSSALIAGDRTFDPLEPEGAAEFYRRMEAAEPRRIPRADLDGHVGLTARELHEVGCTLEPLGTMRLGAAIGWRVVVVAGAFAASVLLAVGLLFVAGALGLLGPPLDPPVLLLGNAGVALLIAYGGLALMRLGIRRLRRLAAERRRAGPHAARPPSSDRHGRATVATVRGPGVLRVQLLWLRGDGKDPRYVEARTLAERRFEDADAGSAEDAVAELSETALRADRAHALRHQGGFAALGVRARRRRPGDRLTMPGPPSAPDDVEREVGVDWRPEPLTDEGQAELARRLVTAKVERWSASVLEPLLVAHPADVTPRPPAWPERRKAEPPKSDFLVVRRYYLCGGIAAALFALLAEGDSAVRLMVAAAGVAVAAAAAIGPRLWAGHRQAERLTRRVRRAAASPPRALEEGLPGAAGLFAVARGRGRGIALLHVRPAVVDGRRGELEVRTLAAVPGAEDDLDTLGSLCAIADEAQHQSRTVGRTSRTVRSLTARLGRVPAQAGAPRLREEPVAWTAALPVLGLLALSVKHTVAGTWLEDGIHGRTLGFAALLLASYLLLRAARRIRDPFSL
jgi:hypothetical protein